jgi:hypothetical protein
MSEICIRLDDCKRLIRSRLLPMTMQWREAGKCTMAKTDCLKIYHFYACVLGCVLFTGCAYEAGEREKALTAMHGNQRLAVLAELNDEEMKYGGALRTDPNYYVPGEANATMLSLKRRLRSLGYEAVWRDNNYVLQKVRWAAAKRVD